MRVLRSIQVLRALAATAVVIEHGDGAGILHGAASVGAAGVDLFFVISGFIMGTTASDKSPRRFLADRAWRVLPMWFFAVAPWILARHEDWQTVLTSLTLWPIWGCGFTSPALWVGWSLCFEMLFYGAFAWALAKGAKAPLSLFAALLVLAIFSGSILVDYVGSPLILEFLAGVAISRLPMREALALPLLLVGIAWLAIAPGDYGSVVLGNFAFLRVLAWGIPAALIVYSARCLESRMGRGWNLPVHLGNASYAVYLFHPFVIAFHFSLLPAVGVSLALGVLVHHALEKPIMSLRRTKGLSIRPQPSLAT
jgi:exopolysaccharide production protein ExoZ